MTLESLTAHTIVEDFLLETQALKTDRFAIWNAHHVKSSQEVAIKIYAKNFLAMENNKEYFENDLFCLKHFFNPFCARYITKFENDKFVFIVLEPLKGGTFKDLLESKTRWNETQARSIFVQVYLIVEYMQSTMNMVHGNICLDIFMVDENNILRLVDFWGTQPSTGQATGLTAMFAPLPFQPPEYLIAHSYSASADFWSLGVFLYFCAVGASPFSSDTKEAILKMDITYPSFLSQSIIDLLKKLMTASPAHRFTIRNIKEHPWFTKTLYNLLLPFQIQNDQFSNEVYEPISNFVSVEELQEDLCNNPESPRALLYNISKATYNANQVYNAISHCSIGEIRKTSLDSDHSLTKSGSLSSFTSLPSRNGSTEQVKVKPVALQLSRPVPVASRRGSKVIPSLPKLQ